MVVGAPYPRAAVRSPPLLRRPLCVVHRTGIQAPYQYSTRVLKSQEEMFSWSANGVGIHVLVSSMGEAAAIIVFLLYSYKRGLATQPHMCC